MDPLDTSASHNSHSNEPTSRHDSNAIGKVEDIKERVQHNVKKVAEQARDQTVKTVEIKKHAVADQIDGIAKVLHKAADQLGMQQQAGLARYAHIAADKLDGVVGTLHNRDISTLLRGTRDWARREPELFVGGAMIAGFLLIRYLTSASADDNHRGSRRSSSASARSDYPSYPGKDGYYE